MVKVHGFWEFTIVEVSDINSKPWTHFLFDHSSKWEEVLASFKSDNGYVLNVGGARVKLQEEYSTWSNPIMANNMFEHLFVIS